MKHQGQAAFTVIAASEVPYTEVDGGPKLIRIHITQRYEGDIQGDALVESLMVYNADFTGSGVGFERIVGSVAGRTGSFVMQHTGVFGTFGFKGTWCVVPGSATGHLRGLRAEGQLIIGGPETCSTTNFEYEFVEEPDGKLI